MWTDHHLLIDAETGKEVITMGPEESLKSHDALIVVDVQNDFCSGGALAVPASEEILPVLNHWIRIALERDIPVIASRDWHTVDHASFQEQDGPWPIHCVQDTPGAEYHPDLELTPEVIRVSKGTRFDQDAYSAFDNTGLGDYLRSRDVKRLWIGGLAQDVCVLHTVIQAREEGFETHVIMSATRPVDSSQGEEAARKMTQSGAVLEKAA